jgi:RimJ/RimL family protein N-acetyltransferase
VNTPSVVPPKVTLREVRASDLPILFKHQLDPEATRMAAFPSRTRDAFMAHWTKIMANPDNALRIVLLEGEIAGYIGAWTDGADRLVGYWMGREFWGRGIASAALSQFVLYETTRPLTAYVARHNAASIRVLLKAGFTTAGKDTLNLTDDTSDEEVVFKL